MTLPDFALEVFFSQWEFKARHHLAASDAQTMSMRDLLALAEPDDLREWESLDLGYRETYGSPRLREAVAETYDGLDASDVLAFVGAQEALACIVRAVMQPGDHAVVVLPNYQSPEAIASTLGDVSAVLLDTDDGWTLDVDEVAAAIRPTTRLVAVNFPNNPTGAVADRETFERLVRLCDERGVRLLSDEVYRGVEQDAARTLPQAADLSPTAVSVNVLSKAYGLPGLRLGWVACRDHALLQRLERLKHYSSICNPGPSEVLGRIALRARTTILGRTRDLIAANLPHFDAFFAAHPDLFAWSRPDGGCVAWPAYLGPDGAEAFCARVLDRAGVLLLPPSVYASPLAPVPGDRFRVGVGRRDPEPALTALDGALHGA